MYTCNIRCNSVFYVIYSGSSVTPSMYTCNTFFVIQYSMYFIQDRQVNLLLLELFYFNEYRMTLEDRTYWKWISNMKTKLEGIHLSYTETMQSNFLVTSSSIFVPTSIF